MNLMDKELIEKIVKLYRTARKPTYDGKHKNILRGRSHSISSITEDLLAEYIGNILGKNYVIYIDQPLSFKLKDGSSKTIYPDIVVTKDNLILSFFDVKMDLGWNRIFGPYCKDKAALIAEMKKNKVEVKLISGTKKDEHQFFGVSKNLKYNVIIVSKENISKNDMSKNIIAMNKIAKHDFNYFILTEGCHPNEYNKENFKNFKIIDNDFKRLRNELKNIKLLKA